MSSGKHLAASSIALTVLAIAIPQSASACAACAGGKSGDAMALGMNMGILALLVVVGSVLIGFAAFAVFLARRAARFPLQTDSNSAEQDAAEIQTETEAHRAEPDFQTTK